MLPYAGSMAEQPAFVVEAIELCELEAQHVEREQARRREEEIVKSWPTLPGQK